MTRLGNQDPHRVLAAADALESELDALSRLGRVDYGDPMIAHQRYRAAVEDLRDRLMARTDWRPTTCTQDSAGARFALMGLRATSTCGLPSAIRNWITQARRKARATLGEAEQ